MMQKKRLRRIAANVVVTPDMTCFAPGVVEMGNGIVNKVFPLTRELPFTEWTGGKVSVRRCADGTAVAYKDGKRIE